MISVFQAFKMILGLIISGFVLYFLIFYAGTYSETEKSAMQLKVLKNFEKLVQDVHYTGNPSPFTDFSGAGFTMLSLEIREPGGQAQIVGDIGKLVLNVPLLFRPGETLFVDRGTIDLGWWQFHAAVAMPETRVVVNPVYSDAASWSYLKDAVRTLPSTINKEPKVTFAICDGGVIVEDFLNLCGPSSGTACEREYFLRIPRPETGMSACTAGLSSNDVLVTISSSCSAAQPGVCFEPPSVGTGNAYIGSSVYMYHDAMDWAALIAGGDRSDIYGTAGGNLWRHKNVAFGTQVGLAAEVMAERARMLATAIEDEVNRERLSADSHSAGCKQSYLDLGIALDVIADNLAFKDYYNTFSSVRQLNEKLDEAKAIQAELVNRGCEPVT